MRGLQKLRTAAVPRFTLRSGFLSGEELVLRRDGGAQSLMVRGPVNTNLLKHELAVSK